MRQSEFPSAFEMCVRPVPDEFFSDIADTEEDGISKSWSSQFVCNTGLTTYITFLSTGWQGENKSSISFGCITRAPDSQCHRATTEYQTSKAPNCLIYIPEKLAFLHIPIRQLMLGTKWQKCTSDLLQKKLAWPAASSQESITLPCAFSAIST